MGDVGASGPVLNVAAAAEEGGGRGGRLRAEPAFRGRFPCARGCGRTFAHQSGTFAAAGPRGVDAVGSVVAVKLGSAL